MANAKKIGPAMGVALGYIQKHPGCNTAEVDRAVRTAQGGHRWMYATVGRLTQAGLVVRCEAQCGRGVGLKAN